MTSAEMKTLLGLRMEDPSESNFSAATKYSALNVAQRTVANFLDESFLTELETRANFVLTQAQKTAGFYGFGSSTIQPIRNRVKAVQVNYGNGFLYCRLIPFDDVKNMENMYLAGDKESPIAYVFGNKLYVRPDFADITGVAVYYLNSPATIADAQNCELNESLHDIVVDLAESELWRIDNQTNRSKSARDSAMDMIKMLNGRIAVEGPDDLG